MIMHCFLWSGVIIILLHCLRIASGLVVWYSCRDFNINGRPVYLCISAEMWLLSNEISLFAVCNSGQRGGNGRRIKTNAFPAAANTSHYWSTVH